MISLTSIKNKIKGLKERKNTMSFTKDEIEQFTKDYASEEGGPAVKVDAEMIAAAKRLEAEPLFLDVEAMAMATTGQPLPTPTLAERPKYVQPRVGGKFAKTDGSINLKKKEVKKDDGSMNLFLIEGVVRMQPNMPGRGGAQSNQTRIVKANDIDEAINKFIDYFQQLSDENSTYVVVGAGGSEAIV